MTAAAHVDIADEIHERRIMACYRKWMDGKAKWPELVALIAERSPDKVARMEKERGLT